MYYHGTSTGAGVSYFLVPPVDTNTLSEKGRNKNLDRVFFTKDLGLAKIYAGRAARVLGGEPVVKRVISPVNIVCMDDRSGASVFHADWAFCEDLSLQS